jgi:hypothetical protein
LTVPEVQRLVLALSEPPERFGFRLGWSRWRRRHQAGARRGHLARRLREQPASRGSPGPAQRLEANPAITEERWARLAPLLPPQKPAHGRPAIDHRKIVEGMLWVMQTGRNWRDLPEEFGAWKTVYSRYRRWREEGLWQQIKDALQDLHPEVSL